MKTKQFVLFQLKSWLPMIIAFGALILSITVIVGLNAQPYIAVSVKDDATYLQRYAITSLSRRSFSCMTLMMVPSLLAAFVLPFFAYSHRYGKVRADCFLSLPVRSGKITQTRMLLAGAILLAIYLVSYLLGIFAAMAKQSIAAASAIATFEASDIVESYTVISGSYGWYFLAWPLGALVVAGLFLINSFLAGQGSNVLQGIIAMILGHAVICLLLPVTILTPGMASGSYGWVYDTFGFGFSFFQMPSAYVPLVLIEMTLGTLESGRANLVDTAASFASQWGLWFGSISFLLLSGGALACLLLGKEPGGEFAGETRPRNFFATLIPHLGFMTILIGSNIFWVNVLGLKMSYFAFLFLTEFIWTDGLYYVVVSLYNRNFKLDRKNWIMFACANGVALILFGVSIACGAFSGR